jgi:CYTH domain-containing protein
MAKEIERKFLVNNSEYKNMSEGVLIKQGYICHNPKTVVRIRTFGDMGFLTIKGEVFGLSRDEFEYTIPRFDAEEMLDRLCTKTIIEKMRFQLEYKGNIWIVDEFKGLNEGLVVAEIELESEVQKFECPEWIAEEVTYDYRYTGSSLSVNPYTKW